MTAIVHSRNILQQQIMVAESVKSYPVSYPALIPLASSVGGISGYSPCSPTSLLQSAYSSPSAFSPAHRMDARSHSPHEGPDGAMSVDESSRSKADIFSQRKQREFIPDNKKDDSYWDRRRRNNEAAKRSREKRRFNDMVLEQRVLELSKENHLLKAQLNVISERYGIQGEGLINVDQVLSSMPQAEQILALSKRNKLSSAFLTITGAPAVSSLLTSGSLSPSPSQYNSSQMSPNSPTQYNYNNRDGRQSPDFYNHRSNSMDRDEDNEEMQEIPNRQEHLHQVPQYASHSYQDAEKQPTYYEQKALNLSRTQESRRSMSSPSPSFSSSHSDYSSGADVEMARISPLSDNGQGSSCLPLKLRHKNNLLVGDKDAAQSLLALHGIKPEPRDVFHEVEDSTSSDERDSAIGMSSSSSPTNCSETTVSPSDSSRIPEHESLEYENTHLRSQIQQLASEVASIKYLMLANPRQTIPSESDSDGSR